MITERQTELLKAIVEEYIKTAHPVSSKSLCLEFDCSSATLRNEMSALEDVGFLEKTHTSSGRVPSEKGYRYYVDNIMKPKELTGEDVLKLQAIFQNKSLVLSDAILKSMKIVSDLTNYTSIVLGNSSNENKISKIEVIPISEHQLIALVVTDKGHVENRNMVIEEEVSVLEIKQIVDLINKFVVGTPIDEVSMKLELEVKPKIVGSVKQQRAIYDALFNVFSEFNNATEPFVSRPSYMLNQPEFNDINKMRSLLNKFEDKELINSIKEEDNGIKIYIGSESEFDDDIAIIKTKYKVNGEEGTIALVGPKRMEYDRVTTLLNYIKENIEK